MRNEPSRALFTSLLVRNVKKRRRRDSVEGVAVTSGCRSRRTENTFFSPVALVFTRVVVHHIFSCLAIQVYRVMAVCFCCFHGDIYVRLSFLRR